MASDVLHINRYCKHQYIFVFFFRPRMMPRLQRQFSFFVISVLGYVCFKTLVIRNSVHIASNDVELDDFTKEADHFTTSTTKAPSTTEDPCSLRQLEVLPKTTLDYGCTDCHKFNCRTLFQASNSSNVFHEARQWMTAHPAVLKNESYFIEHAKDCDHFRKSRDYILRPADPEEADYPLAFNLILHKDVAQIERLLRAIYRPQNEYCLHIDAKASPALINALRAISNCFSNVRLASKLEYVHYAGFSRLQADINCMSDLTTKPLTNWKYLLNLAGQAFPLKTNLEMVRVLKVYNGSNDIEGIFGHRILRGRFENEWLEPEGNRRGSVKKTGKKNPKPPFDIDIVRGSAYGIFSRKFVEYIINDEKAKALLEWSKKTWSPDEHYWATLHHLYSNPHLKTPGGYPGKFRYQ